MHELNSWKLLKSRKMVNKIKNLPWARKRRKRRMIFRSGIFRPFQKETSFTEVREKKTHKLAFESRPFIGLMSYLSDGLTIVKMVWVISRWCQLQSCFLINSWSKLSIPNPTIDAQLFWIYRPGVSNMRPMACMWPALS